MTKLKSKSQSHTQRKNILGNTYFFTYVFIFMIPHFVPDLVEQDDLRSNKELKEHKDI